MENVLRLRLRDIDDGATHAADEDHAAFGLALHLFVSRVSHHPSQKKKKSKQLAEGQTPIPQPLPSL